jgi:hypothetical protein
MIIRNKFNGYVGGNNRLYPGGGGSQPTSTTQTTTTIPEYARPYVERMLGKSEAFSESPYQAYGGERVAGFTPMQEQAFQGAANLGPTKQLGTATQLAGIAGLGGLGAGQQYAQQATNPYAMQSYMSPYIENAMAPQLREAARSSAIMGQQNQAQAVQQGAFGGSRSAIVEAERQRNLAQQQGDIYGRGMQTAFEQARQAQQFGADLGLRGYGMAGQMAGTLGQLGQTQFGQQQGAIQAQAAAGAQQQALEQQKMSQAYQDFLSQRGYPQQQLAFMSDILRGVPLGQQTQVQYQAPPPMASQLAQLGLGAYGVSQMMKKEGGVIKMAEGGIAGAAPSGYSVPPEKLMGMMKKMPTEQLQEIGRSTDNAMTLGIVDAEMNRRQMMEEGQILSRSMPEGTVRDAMMGIDQAPLPDSMFADTAVGEYVPEAPAEEAPAEPMRSGGIVAFAKGKEVKAAPPDDIAAFRAMKPSDALMTEQERTAAEEKGLARLERLLGPDRSVELAEKIAKASELSPEAESKAKMAAAFEMMAAFGEPTPFATAFGKAGAIAGRNIKEYEKLKRESELKANQIRLDTARYERAEKRGNITEADKYADRIGKNKTDLYALENDKAKSLATMQQTRESDELKARTSLESARISAGPGYAAANKLDFNTRILQGEITKGMSDWKTKNPGKTPTEADIANINAAAGERAANLTKQYSGQIGQEKLDIARQDKIEDAMGKWRDSTTGNRQLRDAAKEDKKAGRKLDDPNSLTYQLEQRKRREYETIFGGGAAQTSPPPGQTTPPPPATTQYKEGDTAKDKNGKPIVFRNGTWMYQQ